MRNQKTLRFATLLATSALVFCSFQASPEDIDIFSVDEDSNINAPNVLIVLENNSNWSRQSQQWPDTTAGGQAEDQGQSEVRAIAEVIKDLDDSINIGLMEYVTGGSAGDTDFGFVRYHIRPMSGDAADTTSNKGKLTQILGQIYNNINDPAEKRSSGNPFGSLFHDVYNYLAGGLQANGGAGTPASADPAAYDVNYKDFRSPLTTNDTCTRTIIIFISNNKSTDPTPDSTANVEALQKLAENATDPPDSDAGEAAIDQIPFADYVVTAEGGTAALGYTPLCYTSEALCTADLDQVTCAEDEGFKSCACDAADTVACASSTHWSLKGTTITPAPDTVVSDNTVVTTGQATGEATFCQNNSPGSYTCPTVTPTVAQNTPQAGQKTTTTTTWSGCSYVEAKNACGASANKSLWTPRGTKTVRTVVTQSNSTSSESDLASESACYNDVNSCTAAEANCAGYASCRCVAPTTNSGCPGAGSQRYRIRGTFDKGAAFQTGTFSAAPPGPYMLDEWARFLRQTGVSIPGLNTKAQVTTYTIDTFNANQNADQSALLFNAARVGGGKYFQAKNRNALVNALKQILTEVQAVNSAFSSASLPVNATNRAQNENQVFIGVFKPDKTKDPVWFGNMKRYQLISSGSTIDLGDSLGKSAINNQTGFITDCAVSFWTLDSGTYWDSTISDDPSALSICSTATTKPSSDLPDGPFVEKGAVAEVIRMGNTIGSPDGDGNYEVERTVYTEVDGKLEELSKDNFDDVDPATDNDVMVRFIRGEDVKDEDLDAPAARSLTEPRGTIHGDVVHSRPQPINYGGDPDTGMGVVVYYGANDGHYRAVRAKTGQELWSFVAPESFTKFPRLFKELAGDPPIRYFADKPGDNAPKDYFFDGSTGVFQTADNSSIWIFPTLRRGGRRVYGLNVTDPEKPEFMWSVGCDSDSCPDEFKFMGQSWGLPNVALIKGYCGIGTPCDDSVDPAPARRPVIVLAGGYDPCDDANTSEPACSSPLGSGVYVLDAETGKLVTYFDFTALGVDSRSVPADVALIDVDSDSMVDYGYAVDTGGNIYRFDFIDGPTTKAALDSTKWSYSRVAYTNKSGRKFLFPPALVQITTTKIYLAIGSGDREHPLMSNYPFDESDGDDPTESDDDDYDLVPGNDDTDDPGITNRFYLFKDDLEDVDSATQIDLDGTCPDAPDPLTAGCMRDYSKPTSCTTDPVLPGDLEGGWFIDMGADGPGEQVVTSAVVAAGFVFFSTNRPTATSTIACTTSLGEARGYFLNLLNASGAIGVAGACGGDRSSTFVGGGLPPSPVLATVPIGDCKSAQGCELRTVVIGAVQKTGEPSSPIQSQRVRPPIPSDRKPIYWYKSTGDK